MYELTLGVPIFWNFGMCVWRLYKVCLLMGKINVLVLAKPTWLTDVSKVVWCNTLLRTKHIFEISVLQDPKLYKWKFLREDMTKLKHKKDFWINITTQFDSGKIWLLSYLGFSKILSLTTMTQPCCPYFTLFSEKDKMIKVFSFNFLMNITTKWLIM